MAGRSPTRMCAMALAFALGACATHNARFYDKDGPPESVPSDLASTPDAVPKVEPLNPFANRPYNALGRTYTPETRDIAYRQRGIASWYGKQFHGNRTASGEPYDMFAMTAAHPTLPIPSYARVTNVRDGRSVIVRINDRGPFLYDRIIDLSFAAATRLGIASPGSGEVEVERITMRDIEAGHIGAGHTGVALEPAANPSISLASAPPAPPVAPITLAAATIPVAAPLVPAAAPTPPAPGAPVINPGPEYSGPWSVQVGAFAVPANALALRERLALLLASPEASYLPPAVRSPRVEHGNGVDRVLIGHFPDHDAAQHWAMELRKYLKRDTAISKADTK